MDWYSWLSKTSLDPSLVYDYTILFSNNELEHDDVEHFDHEFLQSMGIYIAKHRLEILKLAKKSKPRSSPPPLLAAKLAAAIDKTKRCIAKCVRSLVRRDNSAIVVVPRASYGGEAAEVLRASMLKRNRKVVQVERGGLLITEGGVKVASSPILLSRSASPMIYRYRESEKRRDENAQLRSPAEETRWDSMFQDLKPT